MKSHWHTVSPAPVPASTAGIKKGLILFVLLVLQAAGVIPASAQTQVQISEKGPVTAAPDSLTLLHSPKKACIYSAVLPGLGQAYNRKYWKIPVIYAGFATLGYFIINNNDNYKTYKDAYLARVDDDPTTTDEFVDQYSDQDLITLKDYYRRNRDLAIIGAGVWYVLNILDASVDAHMFYFDVDDNLTMQWAPGLQQTAGRMQPALSLSLHF